LVDVDCDTMAGRVFQHDDVGTEQLLIATQADDRLTAALADPGITTELTRAQVVGWWRRAAPSRVANRRSRRLAEAAAERAPLEALPLGHEYIGPEHVVLGLLNLHDGTMPVLLTRLGVHADAVRRHLLVSFGGTLGSGADEGVVGPLCPRCSVPLDGKMRVVIVDAGRERRGRRPRSRSSGRRSATSWA
jgi:hypothetical protein